MKTADIGDSLFAAAVKAIDAGNKEMLEQLLLEHPQLATDRLHTPTEEGYFKNPYLLWFIADNPIRNGNLPSNIVALTRFLITRLKETRPTSLQFQLDYALGLVATGRIPRESGMQIQLMDLLIDEGAVPGGGLGALAHGNIDAARHMIKRGGKLTLATAVGLDFPEDIKRLLPAATETEKLSAITVASFYGKPEMISLILSSGVNLNAYPDEEGFHRHATPLHQAVYSGSLESVKLLVNAGARLDATDKVYNGTPLDWAVYMQAEEAATGEEKNRFAEIEIFLRNQSS